MEYVTRPMPPPHDLPQHRLVEAETTLGFNRMRDTEPSVRGTCRRHAVTAEALPFQQGRVAPSLWVQSLSARGQLCHPRPTPHAVSPLGREEESPTCPPLPCQTRSRPRLRGLADGGRFRSGMGGGRACGERGSRGIGFGLGKGSQPGLEDQVGWACRASQDSGAP